MGHVGALDRTQLIAARRAGATLIAHHARECAVYQVEETHYLVDLPGYGYAKVSKTEHKRLGSLVTSYLADREPLSGVVWLLDIRRDLSPEDEAVGAALSEGEVPILAVLTKADKFGPGQQRKRIADIAKQLGLPLDQVLVTSAVSRSGIDELVESIDALVAG